MKFKSFRIDGFKNLNDFQVFFDENSTINSFIGNNGSGKSNIIEAITAIFSALIVGEDGLFLYSAGVAKYGFSLTDGIVVSGGTLDKFDMMVGDYFNSKGLFWDDSINSLIIKGTLTVGSPDTASGMSAGDFGLGLAKDGVWVHVFSLSDGINIGTGILNKYDVMIGNYFTGSGLFWDDSEEALAIKGTLSVKPHAESSREVLINEDGLQGFDEHGALVFAFTLQSLGTIPAGTAYLAGNVLIGDWHNYQGIWYDGSTINFRGIDLTMVTGTESIVQEGDSLTRLADLVIDNLVDGTYGRIKSSALSVDGFIVMDHVVNGTYGKIKVSALTADGLVILDHVVDGTYSKVKTTSIQAGEIRLDKVIHNDTDRFISSTHISAGKLILSATSTSFATGYDPSVKTVTIRATTAPTQRTDGSALRVGDLWINSASGQGNKPYNWGGSSWVQAYTAIDGAHISTGTINANRISISSSRISDVSTNADNTASNTAYNIYGAGSLASGYVLTVDGNIRVNSGRNIDFYYGSTKAGSLTNALLAFIVESFGALQLKGGLMTQIWAQGQDVAYFSSSQITAYRQVVPNSDNTRSLGLTGTRWSHFFTHYINCSETRNIYLGKSALPFAFRFRSPGDINYTLIEAYISPS